ncbi:MAG: SDR family NAD(P)-dependent oxidoreductase [Candidatus Paceibacterota bacterium]
MSKYKEIKNSKVLVTGAAGFIGSHLCESLLERGYKVIGLIYGNNDNIKHLKNNKNLKTISCDVTNFQEILEILKKYKPDGIFHVACSIPTGTVEERNPFLVSEVNAKGTLNLLEACRITNVKKFIYSSSMSVYKKKTKRSPINEEDPIEPVDFYGLSKWQGEEFIRIYAKRYKFNTIILRYAGVYGPRKKEGAVAVFIKNALHNQLISILNDARWDIVYVDDVVLANISAFEKIESLAPVVINIGSGKEINIKDLAQKIINITKSSSKIKISNTQDPLRFHFKIDRAKRLLGFNPTPVRKGLLFTAQWFEERK